MRPVWGIHNDTIPASELVTGGFVSIGWDEMGDLRAIGDDQAALKEVVGTTYPSAKPGSVPGSAGVMRRFAFELAEGDLVVSPSKQQSVYNIGRVTGPYEFRTEAAGHRHRRPVEWLVTNAPREAFSQGARHEMGSALTFFRVANHADEFESAVQDGIPEGATVAPAGEHQVRYGLLQRAILEALRDRGVIPRREVIEEVTRRVELSGFELEPTGSGTPRFEAAISWGSVDMNAAGWLEKTRNGWRLTAAGRRALEETPETDDISKISNSAYREVRAAKRAGSGRFKTDRYPLIDEAVKLVGEGRWLTYSDIATVVGSNPPSVGEYLLNESLEIEGTHRVVPVGRAPYRAHLRELLEAEGVEFDERGIPDPRKKISAEDLREQMDLLDLLPTIPRRAWMVRGSNVNGEDLVPGWVESGQVTLSAASLRPVEAGTSRDALKALIEEDYAHASYDVKLEKLDDIHAFLTRMQDGHLVVTIDTGRLFIGTLTAAVRRRTAASGGSLFVRDVEWADKAGIAMTDLPSVLVTKLKTLRDVADLTQQIDTLEGLLDAEEEKTAPPTVEDVVLRDATADLATRLNVPRAWLQECIDLLNDRPQLIFYGPPGTGKTFLAQAIAEHVAGENVRLVQFHPAYSYEDFFEGYRPREDGGFALKPGPLRKVVSQAKENPRDAHVLIIDEINRGNLAKVFGELYFLLEYRDQNVELLYAEEEFDLPENVYIIGTMNTADRSIALVDAAMRRRFAFLPLHPSEEPTRGILHSWLVSTGRSSRTAEMLDELNRRIEDPDFKIGPSYFMRKAVYEPGGLERAWKTAILPLLEEHHFGELDAVGVRKRYGLATIAAAIDTRTDGDVPSSSTTSEEAGEPADATPGAD